MHRVRAQTPRLAPPAQRPGPGSKAAGAMVLGLGIVAKGACPHSGRRALAARPPRCAAAERLGCRGLACPVAAISASRAACTCRAPATGRGRLIRARRPRDTRPQHWAASAVAVHPAPRRRGRQGPAARQWAGRPRPPAGARAKRPQRSFPRWWKAPAGRKLPWRVPALQWGGVARKWGGRTRGGRARGVPQSASQPCPLGQACRPCWDLPLGATALSVPWAATRGRTPRRLEGGARSTCHRCGAVTAGLALATR